MRTRRSIAARMSNRARGSPAYSGACGSFGKARTRWRVSSTTTTTPPCSSCGAEVFNTASSRSR